MKPDRPDTKIILIDIQYKKSFNFFEEFYGESVSYQELEQKSYIEFKDLMFEKINKDIKFRKHGRIGYVLTIRAYMLEDEIAKLGKMWEKNEIMTIYGWIISNVTKITDDFIDKDIDDEDEDSDSFEFNEDFESD